MVQIQKPTEISILVVGLIFLVLGLLMSQFWSSVIKDNFNKNIPLTPGSESFGKWWKTPVPLYMVVYFWNWTNPEEVYQAGYVPSFVEVGPYVFREIQEKVNLTWNDNGTVTYRVVKKWYFEPDRTNGSLGDWITSVNVVAASASYMTRDLSRFFLYPISVVLRTTEQKIWWTKNVSELLFTGFDNPIQKIGTYFSGFRTMDRFGFFYGQNGTLSDDVFNMATGGKAVEEIGSLKYWNYVSETDHHPGCKSVSGSTGEFWPPNCRKDEPVVMFSTDMCRQIRFYFEENTTYHGLNAYTYAGTKETVDNGTKTAANRCYCHRESCSPSGVFDLSRCQQGAPIFMSFPHFYNADPFYANAIRGMSPSREKHRYFIKLEPMTGVQLEVAARLQINVYLTRNTGLSLFRNITNVFIPVLWLEHHVALTEEFTDGLVMMMKLMEIGPLAMYGLAIAGALTIFTLGVFHFARIETLSCVKKNLKRSNGQYALTKEESALHTFKDDSGKEEVKYVIPEDKL